MALSYPLTLAPTPAPRSIRLRPAAVVGMTASIFTGEQQVQAHAGQWWECDVDWPPMKRAQAQALLGAFVGLNFREGTLLLGVRPKTPLGVAAGSPVVSGGSQTGRTLATTGWLNGTTVKAGDFFHLGSGSGTHLHQVVQDFVADSGGNGSLEIWPALRSSPTNGAALTFTDPNGLWRLIEPLSWSIDLAMIFGLSVSLREAI